MTTIIIVIAVLALLAYAGIEKLRQLHAERQDVGIPARGYTRDVTVTLTVDTSGFVDAVTRASRATAAMARQFDTFKVQLGDALMPAVQHANVAITRMSWQMQVWLAPVEAKWWTRGALYASLGWPDSCVTEEVQRALTEELLFPTQAATAFMRGWVENRPLTPDEQQSLEQLEHARALPLDPHPMFDELATS